jgi:hypothetical protein
MAETAETSKVTGPKKRKKLLPPSAATLQKSIETGEVIAASRRSSGAKTTNIQVCTTDPDAVFLRTKQGAYRPGYVASIATNSSHIIVGWIVHPSSETKPMSQLVSQAQRVAGTPQYLLMDTNYHNVSVAQVAEDLGATLICPPKKSTLRKSNKKYFCKHLDFEYLPDRNAYRCPANQILEFEKEVRDKRRGTIQARYCAKKEICAACPLQSQCTKKHRQVTRSKDEHLLEKLRTIHAKPANQDIYAKRQGSVEPVIGAIKSHQGLTKFRRRGLLNVNLEWCLHACAHNIKRIAALVPYVMLFWLIQGAVEAILETWRQMTRSGQRSCEMDSYIAA